METVLFSRKIDVRDQCQVLVLGGGIAGVCAACAAAREGADVLLVEQYAVTGGNCTNGGVAAFCGETAGQGRIFDEIISRLEEFDAVEPYHPYTAKAVGEARTFNHNILAFVLQEMLLAYGVRLLLHTRVVDVDVDDAGHIRYVMIHGKSGIEAIAAKVIIDATGEAEVADRAGFSTMKGDAQTGLSLPMSMMFFVKHRSGQSQRIQVPAGYTEDIADESQLPMVSVWPNEDDGRSIKVKIPGYDATDTLSFSQAEIYGRRRCMQILRFMQKNERAKLFDHTRIDARGRLVFGPGSPRCQEGSVLFDYVAPQIGIREGRRIRGEYILTVEDVKRSALFEDAIARGSFYLDAHSSADDKRSYAVEQTQRYTDPYQIPYRSLIAKDGSNLLCAGRCFSADQLALSTARVTTTCAMMGQAAGIAAAIAAIERCSIRDVSPQRLRQTVQSRGARLEL